MPEGGRTDADWGPALSITTTPPGPDDAALTRAPCAIAETGTLVYPSGSKEPASWHFRPGLEIAVLKAGDIVSHMEDALARVKAAGMPATLNFVTGPSRTGDIEQTLELGAHGPKAVAILIVRE
jgi:L-lactate utilization protein LutC